MRPFITKALLGLLVLVGLLVICATVIIGTNFADEELSPAARKMLQVPAPSVPDAANGYFVLLGMTAPEGADPLEAGIKLQATLEREYRENPLRTEYTQVAPISGNASDKERCPLRGEDCVGFYLKNKLALLEWKTSQEVRHSRYMRLMGMKDFEEPPLFSVHMPWPAYVPVVRAAEMNLISAVLAIDAGDAEAGLTTIAAEIKGHRRLLAGSRMLIWKMINVSMLRRDYQVLSDVLEHWPELAQTHAPLLAGILQPLDARESDMRQVMEMENLFAANMFLRLRETSAASEDSTLPGMESSGLSRKAEQLFIQASYMPNATLNAAALYWTRRAEAGSGGAATARARKQELVSYYDAWAADLNRLPWKYLRNPAGKVFLTVAEEPGTFFTYFERVYDLDGYIRLVSLQAALRREKVAKADAAAFVQRAAPTQRNPYNGAAMGWDPAGSSLFFEGWQPATANPDNEKKVHRIKMAMPG